MQREPPPFVWATPDEKNILHWNFIIRGPPDSPYANGEFYGVILFPSEYPFKPPGIKMLTPSGRFQPDKKICFSMSDFHPGSWNPAWSVATILTGLLSFMLSDEMTTGSVTTSDVDKRAYAARSHSWNIQQKKFREAFPDYCEPMLRDLPNMAQKERGGDAAAQASISRTASTDSTSSIPSPISAIDSTNEGARAPSKDASLPQASGTGKALSWGQIIWEKWRYWGLVIAVTLIVSRFSSTS